MSFGFSFCVFTFALIVMNDNNKKYQNGFTPHLFGDKPRTFSSKKGEGFTIWELLVVMAIIGIVSAIVLAQNQYFNSRRQLQRAVQELSVNIRWAQGLALETQQVGGVLPAGYGIYVKDASHYLIFYNLSSAVKTYVAATSQTLKEFTLPSSVTLTAGVTQNAFFLKPNPDCYINNNPPGGTEDFIDMILQDNKTMTTKTIRVNDGCLVKIL